MKLFNTARVLIFALAISFMSLPKDSQAADVHTWTAACSLGSGSVIYFGGHYIKSAPARVATTFLAFAALTGCTTPYFVREAMASESPYFADNLQANLTPVFGPDQSQEIALDIMDGHNLETIAKTHGLDNAQLATLIDIAMGPQEAPAKANSDSWTAKDGAQFGQRDSALFNSGSGAQSLFTIDSGL